ncbi:VOC family protein [Leisingera caerulea]|uniref:VOC family protein n=1 Tax=Leisingera caerulea TaxID=506591 RepID=UPI0021A6323F|nr:VOC family protein [Leisingera caerulea]UWQ85123.1 VOC family protein [Leisingera caerulea]
MSMSKTGQVVWHDLFTSDTDRAMAFYKCVAGWSYVIEHSTDFAWGGGAKDFVLALSGDEAGAGIVPAPRGVAEGWLAYVEVPDVDAALHQAELHGGSVVRHPFEVPGVGRNAVIRDPLGALIGVSLSRHSFPVPRRQFGPEVYLSDTGAFPGVFYREVLGWQAAEPRTRGQRGLAISGPSGGLTAVLQQPDWGTGVQAIWVPGIRIAALEEAQSAAEANGACLLNRGSVENGAAHSVILRDPGGALAMLSDMPASPSR